MIRVNVALPSGRTESLLIEQSSKVGDLKALAQKLLGQGFLRLVATDGHVLTEPTETLHAAGIGDGDQLTAIAQQAKLAATGRAFALWRIGGDSVVAWGDPEYGGDSSWVRDQLRNVQQIVATRAAFAAILGDGSVVTWGSRTHGGDSSAVQDQLKSVQQVQATHFAFAAIRHCSPSTSSWDFLTEGRALMTFAKNTNFSFQDNGSPEGESQYEQVNFRAKEPLIRSRVLAPFHEISRPTEVSASSMAQLNLPSVAHVVMLLYWFWVREALRIAALRLFGHQVVQFCFEVFKVGRQICHKFFCHLGWCRKRQLILPARLVKGARKAKAKRRQVVMTQAPKWAYKRGFVTIACPHHTHIGLNNMFRGGGGGARATARRRASNVEHDLLDGLRVLLERFAPTNANMEPPAKKCKTSDASQEPVDDGLLPALQRLVLKAQNEPQGLLESLTQLVQEYTLKAEATNTPPPKGKGAKGIDQVNQAKTAKGKAKGSGKNAPPAKGNGKTNELEKGNGKGPGKGPGKGLGRDPTPLKSATTWASVAASGPPGRQSPKIDKPTAKVSAREPAVMFHRNAFSADAVVPLAEARQSLEAGKVPAGHVVMCNEHAMQDLSRLANLHQLTTAKAPFAAIKADGSVVTWGDRRHGGDSRQVQEQLRDVHEIFASRSAFSALRKDGRVVTWGLQQFGGDSSSVQEQLQDVQDIRASRSAFAAVTGERRVVTWGDAFNGGDSSEVTHLLEDIVQLEASKGAFCALRADGRVVTWGDARSGGDASRAPTSWCRQNGG
eukprot:s1359_g12.t1